MKSSARLTLTFTDAATAKAIVESVSLDDQGYIHTRRAGRVLTATARADNPLSLLHTLDDYLACVSVAERTAEATRPRAGKSRPGR